VSDRYSLALLLALTGVAVAHRRLGPSSSATTSTADWALPSSAVQVRCWSRLTVKNDASPSRRLETAIRSIARTIPPQDDG
jgi:hypothetical protein